MKNIGLIDDKNVSRRAFKLKVELALEVYYPGWKIIDRKPFKEYFMYRQWILENDISVLIIDERLDEEKLDDGTFVRYFGSDLVKDLRKFLKDFPIYCITNIEITPQLKEALSFFNLTINKQRFDEEVENYLSLFIRSGLSFYTEYKKELSRLGELSEIIAKGDKTEEILTEINSLQTRLTIPHIDLGLRNREEYNKELESKIKDIKVWKKELIKYLDEK